MKLKRGMALLLSFVLTISAIPLDARGASSGEKASDEGSVTWEMAGDGTLTVSGDGSIAEGAFRGNKDITAVIIQEGIVEIKRQAFENCANIRSVSLPKTLTTLGSEAFGECAGLTEITIPASLTRAEEHYRQGPFYECVNLKKAAFAGEREEIPANIMRGSGVIWINWPQRVKTIGSNAFERCYNLDSVTMPSSVSSIEAAAFNR